MSLTVQLFSGLSIRDVLSRGYEGRYPPRSPSKISIDDASHAGAHAGGSRLADCQLLRDQATDLHVNRLCSGTGPHSSDVKSDSALVSDGRTEGPRPSSFGTFMAATERPHRYRDEPEIVIIVPSNPRREIRSGLGDDSSQHNDQKCAKVEQQVTNGQGQSWFLDFKGASQVRYDVEGSCPDLSGNDDIKIYDSGCQRHNGRLHQLG